MQVPLYCQDSASCCRRWSCSSNSALAALTKVPSPCHRHYHRHHHRLRHHHHQTRVFFTSLVLRPSSLRSSLLLPLQWLSLIMMTTGDKDDSWSQTMTAGRRWWQLVTAISTQPTFLYCSPDCPLSSGERTQEARDPGSLGQPPPVTMMMTMMMTMMTMSMVKSIRMLTIMMMQIWRNRRKSKQG